MHAIKTRMRSKPAAYKHHTKQKHSKKNRRILMLLLFFLLFEVKERKGGSTIYTHSVNPFSVFMIHFVCVRASVRVCMLFFSLFYGIYSEMAMQLKNTIFLTCFFLFNSSCKFHIFFEEKKIRQKKGRKWNCNWNAPLIT